MNFNRKIKQIAKEKPKGNKVPGGLAQHATIGDLAEMHDTDLNTVISQILKGAKVEKEHTSDIEIAVEIAFDHIYEDLYYYEDLDH